MLTCICVLCCLPCRRTDDTIMDLRPANAAAIHMSAFTRMPPNSLASFGSTSDMMADGTMSPSIHGGEPEAILADIDNVKPDMTNGHSGRPLELGKDGEDEASALPEATMSNFLHEGGAASILSGMVDKVKHNAQRVSEEVAEAVEGAYHDSMFVNSEPLSSRSATPANRSVVSDDGLFESASQRSVRFSDSDSFIPDANAGAGSMGRPESEVSIHSSVIAQTPVRVDVTAVDDHQDQHDDQNKNDTNTEGVTNNIVDAETMPKVDHTQAEQQIQNEVNCQPKESEYTAPAVQMSPAKETELKPTSPPAERDQDPATNETQHSVPGKAVVEESQVAADLATNRADNANRTLQPLSVLDQSAGELSNNIDTDVKKEQVVQSIANQNDDQERNCNQTQNAVKAQNTDQNQKTGQNEITCDSALETKHIDDENTKSEDAQKEQSLLSEVAKKPKESKNNISDDQHEQNMLPQELPEQKQSDNEQSQPSAIITVSKPVTSELCEAAAVLTHR